MQAKKSLGQHFLRSEKALRTIVDTATLVAGENVLEIGPGEGVLTQELLKAGAKVTAVEKDDELYKALGNKFAQEIESGDLTLVHGDILSFEPELERYKLVANIPYNITGAILEKFLSIEQQPEQMVLLVQREVAQRIVTSDNKESILSISVKAYGNPRYIELVKAGSFVPRPKVDSAIISIEGISKDFFQKFSEAEFFRLVRAGFSAKRKKLSSNLSNIFPKEQVVEAFQKLGLDDNTRAEDVDIETWGRISAIIYA